ncbi:MAG: DUF421 domain-containing protein [Planctomycetaceae bacterium]
METITEELSRIFWGDKSLWFLVEIAFRTSIIFGYTLLLLRFMGKRGLGQLSYFEFAIIVSLGSAVGDPMFYDDVPLIHVMLVIAIVISLHQLLTVITRKNELVEKFVEGETQLLVDRGSIDSQQLMRERLSREELFELLRTEGISHLGQVRQAFLEPTGKLSVIRWKPSRSGLSTLPGANRENKFGQTSDSIRCCSECGTLEGSESRQECCRPDKTGDRQWSIAVRDD